MSLSLAGLPACLILLLVPVGGVLAEPSAFPGRRSEWHGFVRYDFEVNGHPALVVVPGKAAEGRPWVWHGEFFGHKPAPDIELLKRGYHIAYLRVPDLLGGPPAVRYWSGFYREMTEKYGLAKKVALVGLSRGGLYCYNWAAQNPDKVACIYGDAPVCDFKSWPGGFGKGKGSVRDWKLVLKVYGFADDDEARAYGKNPVDNLEPLARAGVPLLHVYGEQDQVVPWEENTGLLARRYRALGGSITLIAKPGVGHHPHGLKNVKPIVDFILSHTRPGGDSQPAERNPIKRRAAELEPDRLVVYKMTDQGELFLHVFEPDGGKAAKGRAAYVVFHGGGWRGGSARKMYPYAADFAQRGMVGISVEYRLVRRGSGTTVFDCVRDGRSAIRFIRSHADSLGIDPQRIVVSGGSAGGHVAAGTALFEGMDDPKDDTSVSPVPDVLVLLFPVIDTSEAGYGREVIGERWRELSPLHRVRKNLPPAILFHGTADRVTPFSGVVAFQQAMEKAGNRCRLVAYDGGGHGYPMYNVPAYQRTMKETLAFIESVWSGRASGR